MYTIVEVSRFCRVHKRTVRNWILEDKIEYIRLGESGDYRISHESLEAFLGIQIDQGVVAHANDA